MIAWFEVTNISSLCKYAKANTSLFKIIKGVGGLIIFRRLFLHEKKDLEVQNFIMNFQNINHKLKVIL